MVAIASKSLANRLGIGPSSQRYIAMLGITLAISVLGFFGETVQANHGLGWDGLKYAAMVRDFPAELFNHSLSAYYAGRILPSAIIAETFGSERVILGFRVLNSLLLVGVTVLWTRLTYLLNLGARGSWTGYAGLLLNFSAAKAAYFVPVLVDTSALFVGMMLLVCHLEQRRWLLFASTLIGSFCWTAAGITGAILLLGLRRDGEIARVPNPLLALPVSVVLYALLAVPAVCVPVGNLFEALPLHALKSLLAPGCGPARSIATGLPWLAIAIAASVMLLWGRWSLKLRSIPLAVLALIIPKLVVRLFDNPALIQGADFGSFLIWSAMPPDGKVYLPMVTLFSFYGPLVLLAALRWRPTVEQAHALRIAPIIALALPFTLATEPRYVLLQWPFLVLAVATWADKACISRLGLASIVAFSSALWLPINVERWTGSDMAGLLDWPKQLYFLHYGFWMSWPAYIAQAAIIIGLAIWLKNQLGDRSVSDPNAFISDCLALPSRGR